MTKDQVLVVGAGPTGLVLALALAKAGVAVRVVDRAAQPGAASRALAVQGRTLEFYRQLGLADRVVAAGRRVPGINLWTGGRRAARVPIETLGARVSAFGFPLIFPQDEHERLLIEALAELGVQVERPVTFKGFDESADGIVAQLERDGRTETFEAAFLAGCDGASSAVRHAIGAAFPGGDYQQLFYVADVEAAGPSADGELHVDLEDADFLAVFPLTRSGHARLVGVVQDERAKRAETLTFEDVAEQAIRALKVEVRTVNWFSTYHVHHRVADRFRRGRAFILGDAAHIHSPAGGQGMNTGIGDAINLAWKLAMVLKGQAPPAILDTFEPERIAFARRLVATTDQAFTAATSSRPFAAFIRTRVVPRLARFAVSFPRIRDLAFRTISQVNIAYPGSALSEGQAGRVRAGDRLPWVRLDGGGDNFAGLLGLEWRAHVYGEASPELGGALTRANIPLEVFPWSQAMDKAGLAQGALYLLRPDGHVGLAEPRPTPERVSAYLAARRIDLTGPRP